MKGENKRLFKDLKICKAVKGKHERSFFTSWVDRVTLERVELIYAEYLPRWHFFRKLILISYFPKITFQLYFCKLGS